MVEIKFRVIPEPPQGTRSIYRKKSEDSHRCALESKKI
jgi:hypothetical protein